MIRIFWMINSRLIKGFSVTIYPFFFSIVKIEKNYQNQGRESANSQMCFQHVYSCFIIYIKGQKNQCTKQKRTESIVFSFQFQYSFLCSIQKRWVHINFVSEINWNPKQPTQVYEIRVGYIILCRCVVPKREKNFFFATFLGHQTF